MSEPGQVTRAPWKAVSGWHTVTADAGGVAVSRTLGIPAGSATWTQDATPYRWIHLMSATQTVGTVVTSLILDMPDGTSAPIEIARGLSGCLVAVPVPPGPCMAQASISGLAPGAAVRWWLGGVVLPAWTVGTPDVLMPSMVGPPASPYPLR